MKTIFPRQYDMIIELGRLEKLMPSYIGTSIENKPAYMKRNEKLHKAIHEKYNFIPTIEQAIMCIEKWLDFKHSQPCTNAKGQTIKEVLNEIEKHFGCSHGFPVSCGCYCWLWR